MSARVEQSACDAGLDEDDGADRDEDGRDEPRVRNIGV
jgi:hypothetical protein